ncbi:MAG: transcriptional regulator [Alphaproteobacteria bacterium]|nr:MAG: transcriptional regulator [Alphaproteobacteria bacterium]
MSEEPHIFDEAGDNDTLGGRLWRAREAVGLSEAALAKALGIRPETLRAWESDRSEPRANRLVTIAGLLNVSPTWLLHGVGGAPQGETLAEEIGIVRTQLERIRQWRQQTDGAIASIEKALDRIAQRTGI